MEGRVGVVTGAATGIGRALADVFCGAGMSLALADVDDAALDTAVAELKSQGASVIGVPTDVADAEAVDALAAATMQAFGAVHVVCNNAGVSGSVGRSWLTTLAEWRWVMDVNLFGIVHGVRSFVPLLLEQDEAHIVNTASAAMFEAFPSMAPYAASKHAVLGLSEALYRELGDTSVGVSVLLPGQIVKSRIMSSTRNWPAHLGDKPELDSDAMPAMVRAGFTEAIDQGADPHIIAQAALGGIRNGDFLICDDRELLATWGRHHADLASGAAPVWPAQP